MKTSINLQAPKMQIIKSLLAFEGQTNQQQIKYKSTAKQFRRKFGVDLENAPIIFVAKDIIWKLSHNTYSHKGRTYEYADYLPVIWCKDKFKRLERIDIYNKIYKSSN